MMWFIEIVSNFKYMQMRTSFLLLVSLIFGLAGTFAREHQQVGQDSIIFEKTLHDYGAIKKGSDGDCEFKFTNKGTQALILQNVLASCGCTAPEWPKEPILPGQTGVIKVTYNTDIPGAFAKTISVYSNAKNSPVVLSIKGTVE